MFIGRQYELDRLSALWKKATSSLVVISGRRRIGKSTLVEFFAEKSDCQQEREALRYLLEYCT